MPPHQPLVSASLLLTALLVASSCSPVVADAGGDPHVGSPVDSGLTDGEDGADCEDGADGTDGTDDTGGEDDGSDGADGSFDYDCDALPVFNEGDEVIEHARGYHGLVFDDEGHILGWDGRNNVVRATYDGDSEVWLPGLPGVEQMARHPDGTIYLIDSSEASVVRVSPSGAREVVARGF